MNFSKKLLLFLLPIFGLYILVFTNLNKKKINFDDGIIFVGSSRVLYGINPNFLQKCYKNKNIINLGIPESTFKHNIFLSGFLIENSKVKEINIELSPILNTYPKSVIEIHQQLGLNFADYFKYIDLFNFKQFIENWFFQYLNLKHALKNVFFNNIQNGYYKGTKENKYYSNSPFLKFTDLNKNYGNSVLNHQVMIKKLLNTAIKKKVKIRFFLPLTFKREYERHLTIDIYHSLPDSLKIPMSKSFLVQINNPKFLKDDNHLNSKGAQVWSEYLCFIYQ